MTASYAFSDTAPEVVTSQDDALPSVKANQPEQATRFCREPEGRELLLHESGVPCMLLACCFLHARQTGCAAVSVVEVCFLAREG
jgi:hypothetical protein